MNVVAAISAFFVVSREVPTWGYVTPAHIPGILPWSFLLPDQPWPRDEWIVPSLTNENRIWIIAPACVIVVVVAVFAARRRPVVVASALIVLSAVGTVAADARTDFFHEQEASSEPFSDRVTALAPPSTQAPIGYSRDCGSREGFDAAGENYLAYGVLPTPLQEVYRGADIEPDMNVVVACDEWALGQSLGARPVKGPSTYGSRIWIMPGDLQDRLLADGRLDLPPSP